MNTALRSFVPNWFRQGESDMADDEMPPPPLTAIVPMPEPTEEERRLKVIADAHVFVAQLAQEREAKDQQIEQLQAEVGRLAHQVQQEIRKSGLLELDVVERDNTIATLQSDIIERKGLLDLLRDINAKSTAAFDRLNITGTKKERKPRAKNGKKQKTDALPGDRQNTDKAPKATGVIGD